MGKFLVGLLAFYTVGSIGAMAMNLGERLEGLSERVDANGKLEARNRAQSLDLASNAQRQKDAEQ